MHLPWAVTAGVTADRVFRFVDDTGDRVPVDSWVFAAAHWDRPGGTSSPLTVDVSQASVGEITVTVDDAVSTSWSADRVWSLVATVAGEPAVAFGGPLLVARLGARGRRGVPTVRTEVEVAL